MKLSSVVAVALLLLSLLSAFSLIGMNPEAGRYDRSLATVSKFARIESVLRQDVLNARTGLLRNYDPLDREMRDLEGCVDDLRRFGVDVSVLRPLEELLQQQDALTQKFKSNNALLRNSLAYFAVLGGQIGREAREGPLATTMTDLATSMLYLMVDTSPASARVVAIGLDRLAAQPQPGSDTELINALLLHGWLLHDLLPATDGLLKSLHALPRIERQEAVRSNILAAQRSSRAEARWFRLLLYATSLLLIGVLVSLGLQLRRHVIALRRRAELESIVAAISMQLVAAETDEIAGYMEGALAALAAWVGVDRAYFIGSLNPMQLYAWKREDDLWPPDWPMSAITVSARIGLRSDGIVHVRSVANLSEGFGRTALAAAGLRSWVCLPIKGQGGGEGAFGFDGTVKLITWSLDELKPLRAAVETVANAVGRVLLERDRARLEASLQHARRMETVGAFASGIAHNFNNIIGAILGYAEMLEAESGRANQSMHNVNGIRRAAERARDLVDQIMTFGRQREDVRRRVALRPLMVETSSLLFASLPEGVRLVVNRIPDAAAVSGDPVQLQQVIINLCNNAAQAMDGLGTVGVTIQIEKLTASRRLSHGNLGAGRYVRIAVIDSGRGMGSATLERLFEPFFTTRVAGNGLGLATVREIVSAYGGAMNVSSDPGRGSLVEAWLPQLEGGAPAEIVQETGLARGNGETVLVIDEDRDRLLHDEDIISALGYEPIGFADPAQALDACRAEPHRFDALLVGHITPLAKALELARTFHSLLPKLPILLAAPADELGSDVLAAAGISAVVGRPLTSVELACALSRWLPG